MSTKPEFEGGLTEETFADFLRDNVWSKKYSASKPNEYLINRREFWSIWRNTTLRHNAIGMPKRRPHRLSQDYQQYRGSKHVVTIFHYRVKNAVPYVSKRTPAIVF